MVSAVGFHPKTGSQKRPAKVAERLNSVNPERRFSQLYAAADKAVRGLRGSAATEQVTGLATAAVAVGRVLGFVEGIAYADVGVASSALDSAQRLLDELDETCAALEA
jgi:hypothetical protein